MERRIWVLVGALASLVFAGTVQAGLLVSEKDIKRQARLLWLETKRHVPLDPDPRVQRYVQCVADSLIAVLPPKDRDNTDWEVVVFDDAAVNAAADPNGKIAVYSGLLRVADTPDALAAVLGHEIAHKTQNHVMEQAKKGVRSEMLVVLGAGATGISPGLLEEGATIGMTLPYARAQESAADRIGLQYMAKAGYDPRAAMYLWKKMAATDRASPPEILSDHPADDTRLEDIVKVLTPALIEYNKAREAGKRPNCQVPAR